MTTTTRTLRRLTTLGALAAVAYVATPPPPLVWGGGGPCKAQWCQPGATIAEGQRVIDAQVNALTRDADCWTPNARKDIPATVLVKGAKANKSVVWSMSLTEAFDSNRDRDTWNDVIVIRGCAAASGTGAVA